MAARRRTPAGLHVSRRRRGSQRLLLPAAAPVLRSALHQPSNSRLVVAWILPLTLSPESSNNLGSKSALISPASNSEDLSIWPTGPPLETPPSSSDIR
ncbi:hypothetical protein ANCDUO_12139 [Ancylostoma duodenale]|uniref:Uncharacterized protein n=1 Tax=Ancylostoma duodenale TaxID=51022 RepID=A0A0C2G9M6_9BILA|nr:hypothetical protein ANCDUO_12139 [Ancylostoma duodenale]